MGKFNGKNPDKSSFRVAFTGPECSGKTTLSRWCAAQFNLPWVSEKARDFLKDNSTYNRQDIAKIGEIQFNENHAQNRLICDTELTVIRIWEKVKFGAISSSIEVLSQQESYDVLFLCVPDIPWIQDPLRENPLDRDLLYICYEDDLKSRGIHYVTLHGSLENRKLTILEHFKKHRIFASNE